MDFKSPAHEPIAYSLPMPSPPTCLPAGGGLRLRAETRKKANLVLPLLLAAVAVLPFLTALGAGFVFDDEADVAATAGASASSLFARIPFMVRPVLKASYALGVLLHGPSPTGFRTVNVALHVASSVLLFLLARRWKLGDVAAFAGAALWALHPLAAETVTYISGRSMGLSTTLALGAMWMVARDEAPSPARAFGAGVLAFMAPLARETALVLPLLMAWWEATLSREISWRDRLRRHAPILAGTLAAAGMIFAIPRHRELVAFSLAARAPLEALRGNVQAAGSMLGLWAFPWRISIDPAPPLEWGWTEGPTLMRLAALGLVGAWVVRMRRRAPWPAFGAGWMLIAILPSNSIVWRLDPVGVRPLYLASLGPAWLACALIHAAQESPWRPKVWGRVALGGALSISLALGAGLAKRNALYRSPIALWEDAARKAPRSARARINLGYAYLDEERLDEAEAALRAGLERAPWMRQAECGLVAIRIRRDTLAQKRREGRGEIYSSR